MRKGRPARYFDDVAPASFVIRIARDKLHRVLTRIRHFEMHVNRLARHVHFLRHRDMTLQLRTRRARARAPYRRR